MSDEERQQARAAVLALISGYRLTQAAYVVAKLGVADRLGDGPKDARTLAAALHVHPDRLFRILRVLASVGLFELDGEGRFSLTETGSLLRNDLPGSMAALTVLQGEEGYRAFSDLLHTVRTGETAFDHVFGMGHFDYLTQHPEARAVFDRAMVGGLPTGGDPLLGYDLKGRTVVVDVGGGRGALLAAVLRTQPQLKGILFDLPEAVAEAPAFLAAAGVQDRCSIRTGSAFESIPSGGDVYVMSRVLHDWPDERADILLRNCRSAIAKDGVLLVRESVLPEGSVAPARAQRDLMMMVMNGGRERTEAEWRALLGRSGFGLSTVRSGPNSDDLLEARPL